VSTQTDEARPTGPDQPRPGPPPLRSTRTTAPFPLNLYQTAVGKKWVMALTGIGLLGFVVAHMIGNLHIYEGPIQLAEYAEALRDLGGHLIPRTLLLWVMRLGLIAMFALHIHSAYTLKEMSRISNTSGNVIDGQQRYAGGQDYIAADFASRTMRWTGPIIALYLIFHLADLTWGLLPWTDYVRGDPYHNVTTSLGNWPVAILYVVAMVALAVHIYHGTWSLFQSLGLSNPRYDGARRGLAAGLAGLVLLGNLSFPILVQASLVDEDACDDGGCVELEVEVEEGESAVATTSGGNG
jgi:succinate dehydrogenase / fumarate reductase cytochrome b subunit